MSFAARPIFASLLLLLVQCGDGPDNTATDAEAARRDTQPPTVTIATPVEGSSLSAGDISVVGGASDTRSGVAKVEVRADEGQYVLAKPIGNAEEWSQWTATLSLSPGTHKLLARATDRAGHPNWAEVHVNVSSATGGGGTGGSDGGSAGGGGGTGGGGTGGGTGGSSIGCNFTPAATRTLVATSLSELTNQIANGKPGDKIILKNGTYTMSAPLAIRSKGTASAPIVIAAESVGGVSITGSAGFQIVDAAYTTLCGFKLRHRPYAGGQERVGLLVDRSNHVRITRNDFALTNDVAFADWVLITGSASAYNSVDHNKFQNKSNEGVFVYVEGASDESYISHDDSIRANYFLQHSFGGSNGGEAVRIGDSPWQHLSARATIAQNLFEQCNGDSEIVSNKSADNLIAGNTFRNNRGSVMMRHGHRATVDGNFFIANYRFPAIEVYGNDHRIINNYFEAHNDWAVVYLGNGDVEDDVTQGGSDLYDRPRNTLVAFNTFVNNALQTSSTGIRAIKLGCAAVDCPEAGPLGPINAIIANNIVQANSGSAIGVYNASGTRWEGNYFWGSAPPGDIPAAGYARTDPGLTLVSGVFRLSATSAAVGRATPATSYSAVARDLDGQARRDGAPDVGADELDTTTALRKPLTATDVGPMGLAD